MQPLLPGGTEQNIDCGIYTVQSLLPGGTEQNIDCGIYIVSSLLPMWNWTKIDCGIYTVQSLLPGGTEQRNRLWYLYSVVITTNVKMNKNRLWYLYSAVSTTHVKLSKNRLWYLYWKVNRWEMWIRRCVHFPNKHTRMIIIIIYCIPKPMHHSLLCTQWVYKKYSTTLKRFTWSAAI